MSQQDQSSPINRKSLQTALKLLHALERLGLHPLANLGIAKAKLLEKGYDASRFGSGQALRDILVAAIERLKPEISTSDPTENVWRQYSILKRHFVDGISRSYLLSELGVVASTYDHTLVEAFKRLEDIIREQEQSYWHISNKRTTVLSNLSQLPPPLGDFTGRTVEITDLLNQVREGKTHSVGIFGMGGVGKTAIAQKLAELLLDEYYDAQIYLDLRGASLEVPLSTLQILTYVIQAFGFTVSPPESERESNVFKSSVLAKYRSILRGKKGVLFLDNAARAEQIIELIPPQGWLLLVTSRQRFAVAGMLDFELEVLTPIESSNFLILLAPRIGKFAGGIADLCGYLPLALRLAGSALRVYSDISPEYYLGLLRDEQQRLKLLDSSSEISDASAIAASLYLSFKLLDAKMQRAWAMLAIFPAKFDLNAANHIWGLDIESAQKIISNLIECSLLEFDPASERYHLHSLVRLYAVSRLRKDDHLKAEKRLSQHFLSVLTKVAELYKQGHGGTISALRTFELEWQNIQIGQSWAATYFQKDLVATELCVKYALAGSELFFIYLKPTDQIEWYEVGLAAARLLSDRLSEGKLLRCLGRAYFYSGDQKKAIGYFEEALTILRQFGDLANEAVVLNDLGSSINLTGDAEQAIKLHKQARKMFRSIGDTRAEGIAIGDLGIMFSQTGRLKLAIEYYKCQLKITRDIGDRLREGNCLSNLGLAYIRQGKPQDAVPVLENTLNIRRELHDRRGELQTLNNLGWALSDLKDYTQSTTIYLDILPLAKEFEDLTLESNIIGNIANNHFFGGQYIRAIEYYERQLNLATEIGYPSGMGNALNNMGEAYMKLGDAAKTKTLAGAALEIYRKASSLQGEAAALLTLRDAYFQSGEYLQAADCNQQALEIYRKVGNRSDLMEALLKMCEVCDKLGQYVQRQSYARDGLKISEQMNADELIEKFTSLLAN
jgi:tetratricopeptide (TPR) repeat protein